MTLKDTTTKDMNKTMGDYNQRLAVDKKRSWNKFPGVIDGRNVDDMVGYLKQLVEVARDNRDKHPNWDDFEEAMTDAENLHLGNHKEVFNMDALGLSSDSQYVIENHIFTVVEVVNGIITAYRPGFQWKPPDTDNMTLIESANLVSKSFDMYSQNMGIEQWYPDSTKQALIYGHCLARLYHSFERDSVGKDEMDLLDPLSVFIEKDSIEWKGAKYRGAVIIEEKLKIKSYWENRLGKKVEFPNYNGLNVSEAKHWNIRYCMNKDTGLGDHDNIARGLTMYIEYDDRTRVPRKKKEKIIDSYQDEMGATQTKESFIESEDVDKNGKALSTELKYPNGRLFVIFENDLIYDGDVLDEHGESQFMYLPGKKVDGFFLGIGYPHILYDLQKNINEAVTQINLNSLMTANPNYYGIEDAFASGSYHYSNIAGKFDNVSELGKKLMMSGVEPVKRYSLGDNTGQAYNRYVELVSALYRIVGIEEAVRGISKSGDSGIKVQELYANAVVRFRPDISQSQYYLLKPYGNRLMKNMIQYKTAETIYIGEDYEDTMTSVNIYDELAKLRESNIELQLKLIVGTATADQRTMRSSEIVQYKQLLPESIPDWLVLEQSDNVELIKIGKMLEMKEKVLIQNQMKLAQIMPQLEEMTRVYETSKGLQNVGKLVGGVMNAIKNMQGESAPVAEPEISQGQ